MTLLDLANIPDVLLECEMSKIKEFPYKAKIQSYIDALPKIIKTRQGLLLWGNYGAGKSGLASIILKEAAKLEICGFWLSCKQLPGYVIKETIWRDGITFYDRAQTVPILVLDELQIREERVAFLESCVEDLLRIRVSKNKPTILTTNHTPSSIKASYPAIYSVMEESTRPFEIAGMEFRHDMKGICNPETWS